MKKLLLIPLIAIFIPHFVFATTCDRLANKIDALYSEYQDYNVKLTELTEKYYAERASYLSTGTSGVGQGNVDRLYFEYIADYNQIVAKQQQTAIEYDSTVIEYNACTQQEAIDDYENYLKEQEKLQIEAEQAWQQSQREAMVTQAVLNCDFDFFENEMTNDERMDTWDERQSCTKKSESTSENVTSEPSQIITNEVAAPIVTTDTPPDTKPSQPQSIPSEAEATPNPVRESDNAESNLVADTVEFEGVGTISSTDNQAGNQPDTNNEPESFLKRVWKTVVGWFSW